MNCCENLQTASIQLTQGDDSNAMGHYIRIKLASSQDLTGWYAIVQLANFQWRYDDLTSGTLEWVVSHNITSQLAVGRQTAAIKIFDAGGTCRTIARNIPVFVNKSVVTNPQELSDGE